MPLIRIVSLLVMVGALAAADVAFALVQRTFVASFGNDANACSSVAPCRSFTGAIAKTLAGGEVIVLDSAGYGPVTITQSVSIIAPPGIYAGITVSGSATPGVLVNAPSAVVTLRGLTINALADNNYGIVYEDAAKLFIDRVTISGFRGATGFGIVTSNFSSGVLYASDVVVRQSTTAMSIGGAAAGFVVGIDHARLDQNQSGIGFGDNVKATLSDVTIRASAGIGLVVGPSTGATADVECDRCIITDNATFGVLNGGNSMTAAPTLTLRHSLIARNSTGLASGGSSKTFCSDTTITGNNQGVDSITNGTNYSFGDNMLYGNTTEGTFSPLPKS